VHAGDYLLAIDGVELKAPLDPYSLLIGKQDSTVQLAVANGRRACAASSRCSPSRTRLPCANKPGLITTASWWIRPRAAVSRTSISPNGCARMDQFIRQFYAQIDKQAISSMSAGTRRLHRFDRSGTPAAYPGWDADESRVRHDPHSEPADHRAQGLPDQSLLGIRRRYLPLLLSQVWLGPLIGTRTWAACAASAELGPCSTAVT